MPSRPVRSPSRAPTACGQTDEFGQVVSLSTPDQPNATNVPETLVYVATEPDQLSHRLESLYSVTVGPIVDMGGTHSYTRFESPVGSGDCCIVHDTHGCADPDCEAIVCDILPFCCMSGLPWDQTCVDIALEECACFPPTGPLSIEIENFMASGPNGGVLVRIRAINKAAADPFSVKLFYYCDFDISDTNTNDEATPIFVPPGQIRAIEQFDAPPADPPKPLWFGGCSPYAGWEIGEWEFEGGLRGALDAGRAQLANADTTPPGTLDHVCALSSETVLLGPGESMQLNIGIGGPDFYPCGEPHPCPCDCEDPQDGAVDVGDFLALLAQWGAPGPCDCEAPPDGAVDVGDFLAILAFWGPCP
ncbi:MAG: hypothetical protein ACYSWT_13635 [Planctomycetota bacterium]